MEGVCQKIGLDSITLREQHLDFQDVFPRLVKTISEAYRVQEGEKVVNESKESKDSDYDDDDDNDDDEMMMMK